MQLHNYGIVFGDFEWFLPIVEGSYVCTRDTIYIDILPYCDTLDNNSYRGYTFRLYWCMLNIEYYVYQCIDIKIGYLAIHVCMIDAVDYCFCQFYSFVFIYSANSHLTVSCNIL